MTVTPHSFAVTHAKLYYGRRSYDVNLADYDASLMTWVDGSDLEAFARRVLAVMSHASGGHVLTACAAARLNSNVAVSANGVHVYYANPLAPTPSGEAWAERVAAEMIHVPLGSVVTDQYGKGFERARWSTSSRGDSAWAASIHN